MQEALCKGQLRRKHLRLAFFWTAVGLFANIAVLPAVQELAPLLSNKSSLSLPFLIVLQFLQGGILLFVASWAGLRLGASIGLDSPFARAWVYHTSSPSLSRKHIAVAILAGVLAGVAIIALDVFCFAPLTPEPSGLTDFSVPRWKGFLASFYGGIVEELLLRMFVMTLLVWSIWKTMLGGKGKPTAPVFWGAIFISAFLFGLGHLPAAANIWPLTPIIITRIIVLNAIVGVPCGCLYWKLGIEHAMLAHFCADIILHVLVKN